MTRLTRVAERAVAMHVRIHQLHQVTLLAFSSVLFSFIVD